VEITKHVLQGTGLQIQAYHFFLFPLLLGDVNMTFDHDQSQGMSGKNKPSRKSTNFKKTQET